MIFRTTTRIVNAKILTVLFTTYLFVFCETYLSAQKKSDAGLWSTVNLKWNIHPKFSFLLIEEMRLKENFTTLNLFYTGIGLEYRIIRNLKTSFVYRSTQRFMPDGFFSLRHRIHWDILVKKKSGSFNFSYRHRLQAEVRNIYSSEKGYFPEWFSRNKLQVKYDTDKPYNPYISIELRQQIHDPRNPELDNFLTGVRYQLGGDYKLNSKNTIGLYYILQDRLNTDDIENLYLIGLEYTFEL